MHEKFFVRVNEYLEKFNISTFEIFLSLALITLILYFIHALEKKLKYSREKTNKFLVLFSISLGITYLFAHYFDALFHFFEDGEFGDGITFIAGLLGGVMSFVLLVYFFAKEERKNILIILNLIIPGIILAHAIGRIGCFSVGCCYGLPTESIFGIYFPEGTIPYDLGIRVKIHPTQLYEAIFLFGLFFLLKLKLFKNNEFSCYLIFYAIFRFILEVFFRGDSRGLIFNIAPSVLLSILMFIIGIVLLCYTHIKHKRVLIK